MNNRNWSYSEKVLVYSTLQIESLSANLNVLAKRKDEYNIWMNIESTETANQRTARVIDYSLYHSGTASLKRCLAILDTNDVLCGF